jgi:uncharacterized protein YegP (UPF0339 family)
MKKSATIKLHIYKSHGQWRWKIIHRNGNNIANGGEGYKRKTDCKRGLLRLVMALSKDQFDIAEDWYTKG